MAMETTIDDNEEESKKDTMVQGELSYNLLSDLFTYMSILSWPQQST